MRPELRALELADAPARWEALGFSVSYGDPMGDWKIGMNYSCLSPARTTGVCDLAGIRLRLGADGQGIAGWTLTGISAETSAVDGLRTALAGDSTPPPPPKHPNDAIALDHVVVTTPAFDRTAAALEAVGIALRRVLARPDGRRMGFRRLGPAILELVEADGAGAGTPRFWGLVVVVEDLDVLAERLGEHLGSIRDAVQPGRRIATLRQSAGLGEAVAFMSPKPGH